MGRNKKFIIDETIVVNLNDLENQEMSNLEIIYTESIHDKYRSFIDQSKSGYLRGFEYPIAMEILRWCENKIGRSIPLNMSCGSCLLDLVKLFTNLE